MPPTPLNPEDLASFALDQSFHESAVKKVLTSVPVRKPAKGSFVRTHPNPENWKTFGLIEFKDSGKIYLVSPAIAASLRDKGESMLTMANLVLSVDKIGNAFFWPLKISERANDWTASARRAAELAKNHWLRVTANQAAGCYDAGVAVKQDTPPSWPVEDYNELLRVAFRDRLITTMDHPALLELEGA